MQNRCQDVEVNQHHNAALAVPRGGEVVPHLSSKTENAKLLASLADLKRTRPMNILRRRFLLISASAFAMSRPILGAILPDVDVAVIGAGMAGLAAAQRLRAGGLRAAVSEARTRICGREFTEHQDSASLSITAAPGLMQTLPISLSRSRINSVFGKIWTPISPVCLTRLGKCPRRRTCAWTPLTVVYNQ